MLDRDNWRILYYKMSIQLLCRYLVQHLLHQIKAQQFYNDLDHYQQCYVPKKTSSPMGNDRSSWSQHNVWRHHNLRCSKADNSELETVTKN